MPNIILSDTSASVSELKKNPMATVSAGDGYPVAILNRNQPAFYCIPAELYERMLDALFTPKMRPQGYGFMEYDAYWEGKYIYSHLDSDIARLVRFRQALETQTQRFEVLCYPWQTDFLRAYLGQHASIKQLEMEAMETALGIRSEHVLEGGA